MYAEGSLPCSQQAAKVSALNRMKQIHILHVIRTGYVLEYCNSSLGLIITGLTDGVAENCQLPALYRF
jgi:hypothetical protein